MSEFEFDACPKICIDKRHKTSLGGYIRAFVEICSITSLRNLIRKVSCPSVMTIAPSTKWGSATHICFREMGHYHTLGDNLRWNPNAKSNSLWPRYAIWLHKSVSTLPQVTACYLTAASHYLNQCSFVSGFQGNHLRPISQAKHQACVTEINLNIIYLKFHQDLGGQWVNLGKCNSTCRLQTWSIYAQYPGTHCHCGHNTRVADCMATK